MRKLRAQAELLAQTQVPVLILGESGSGKSTAAQLIHGLSVRSGLKLVKLNCAALPSYLLEEELFGCTRELEGRLARARTGKLEWRVKGTLLLDEIAEMPPNLQHRLLQVLQNRQLARQRKDKDVAADVRILASSGANIDEALSGRKFREDLYYYLSAFTLHVPSLRQRKEEIPLLLHHFMQQLAKQYGLPPRKYAPAVLEACQRYSWPGNLSELERFVKRHLVMPDYEFASGKELIPGAIADVDCSISPLIVSAAPVATQVREQASAPDSLKSFLHSVRTEAEKNAITAALQKTGWNRKAAARMIKVSYRTLLYKIDQYHLRPSTAQQLPAEDSSSGNGTRFKGNGTVR